LSKYPGGRGGQRPPPDAPVTTDEDIARCAVTVRAHDPDRFRAAMVAPVAGRARLLPLYAFNLEVARAPWVSAEPMICEMRLQFWRDVLEEIAAGGPVRRHAVATPLAPALAPTDARRLDALVTARRWDIAREPFAGEAALMAHLDALSGHLMWTAARCLGAPETAEPVVRDLALGDGIARWLAAVPLLEGRGRAPLPDDGAAGIARLAGEGRARLAAARRRRRDVAPAALPALLPAAAADAVLAAAEGDPERVRAGRLAPSEARRRGLLAWPALSGRW